MSRAEYSHDACRIPLRDYNQNIISTTFLHLTIDEDARGQYLSWDTIEEACVVHGLGDYADS